MRHNQPQRIAMVRRKRLAIMVRGEENIIAVKISQRNVCRESLLGVNQNMLRFRLEIDEFEHFLKRDALPIIVKAAPARNTMKVAVGLYTWHFAEFIPRQPHRLFHQAANAEVPARWVEAGDGAVM